MLYFSKLISCILLLKDKAIFYSEKDFLFLYETSI